MSSRITCLFAIACAVLVAACTSTGTVTRASTDEAKRAAAAGWVDIVRTYFSQSCDQYRTLFTPEIKIVNPYIDTVVASAPLFEAESLCDRIGLWTGGLMSLEDYLARYDVVVYTRREIADSTLRMSELDKRVLTSSINSRFYFALLNEKPGGLTDDDYLVFGDLPKDTSATAGLGSPFTPVIRRTPEGWKIFAMLP